MLEKALRRTSEPIGNTIFSEGEIKLENPFANARLPCRAGFPRCFSEESLSIGRFAVEQRKSLVAKIYAVPIAGVLQRITGIHEARSADSEDYARIKSKNYKSPK